MPILKGLQMSLASLKGFNDPLRHHSSLNGRHIVLDFRIRQQNGRVALDVADIAIPNDVGWHLSFEFTFPPEHHDGNQLTFIDPKKLLKCFGMPVVLVKGILETEFLAEQAL